MTAANHDYVHGYTPREAERLQDQADTLRALLLDDTEFPAGALVLEAGCGTGAQTETLALNNPEARIVSVDINGDSLSQAARRMAAHRPHRVRFARADIFAQPFADETFDHVFVCFVLEHLPQPVEALAALKRLMKPGATITAIEGDHGSCYFHPETDAARRAWQCLIDCQAKAAGDSLIGRSLYPLLDAAGYREVNVSPRLVYADASRPRMMDGFVKKTIIPMVEGVRAQALAEGMIDAATWEAGIRDLHETGEAPGGTFLYTFFKALAVR